MAECTLLGWIASWIKEAAERSEGRQSDIYERLSKFRQTVDNPKPDLIADLHLHHLRAQAGPHALGVLKLELYLTATAFASST